ncbi:hypothetical protein ACWCQ1_49525 [Streptomyces sp. NPDC002144]
MSKAASDAWAVVGHDDVGWLQIPVYEPAGVDGWERLGRRNCSFAMEC